jgi:hypothetical protein
VDAHDNVASVMDAHTSVVDAQPEKLRRVSA